MLSLEKVLDSARDLLRALRPNQWTKNLAVFAALFFAFGDRTQSLTDGAVLLVCQAFCIFCAASSAIYLVNDIADRERDRAHPLKCRRPIAAGTIPVHSAAVLAMVIAGSSLLAALALSPLLAAVILAYLVLQIAYSLLLKHATLVDVFVIAIGFVLRAAAGGVVLHVTISAWFLLCAFLLALFLALCKRRHEKNLMDLSADARPSLHRYDLKLLDQLIAIVSAAVIVCYSIYTLWPETTRKFGTSGLALTIPFVIFGIFRYLELVYRKDGGGRPEKVLLSDVPLLANLFLYGLTVLGVFLFT